MTTILTLSKDDFEYVEPKEELYLQHNNNQKLENLDSESLFKKQKNEIIRIKKFNTNQLSRAKKKKQLSNYLNNQEKLENSYKNISFINQKLSPSNDLEYFEKINLNFSLNDLESDFFPLINNNKWEKSTVFKYSNDSSKPIEIKNLAICSGKEINYDTFGLKLKINFSLKGESQLWIFTRCFINKDLNESSLFDSLCVNKESNDIFNKYSTSIKISKKENSNQSFINFGTFTEENNQIIYKTFVKRQLIDFNKDESKEIYYSQNNDGCDYQLIINDDGSETIETKTFLNNSPKENNIKFNLYLPNNKYSKILFCGIGDSVEIKKILFNTYEKHNNEVIDTFFNKEKKECNCCLIF